MSEKRDLIRELLDRNILLTPDAHELLKKVDTSSINIDQLADALKNEIVVSAEILTPILDTIGIQTSVEKKTKIKTETKKQSISSKEKTSVQKDVDFIPVGKSIKKKLKVLLESTDRTSVIGDRGDFETFFRSRYNQLYSIIKSRGDITNTVTINDLQKAKTNENDRVQLIGMIKSKRSLKTGGLSIEIEDITGSMTVIISGKNQELVSKAGALLDDQVAGFSGRLYDNIFVVNDFVFPDVPISSKIKTIDDPISVCFTSDLHIGSKEFLEDAFKRLISFLNGDIDDPYQRTVASQIKYLIINGDVVEGIGVYPDQENDLLIKDIYEQYKYAAKLLSEVPDWIHILIVSGNHDACRLALPQPAISKEYAPDLWKMKNVTMLSNPSTVDIHGKIFLLYHGNSFEDVASLTPGLNMNDPNGPMIYTLRFRHLAPTYGRNVSIVPSKKDELVIERIPHVYHTGHIHINSHTQYRGVECINSGTFQSQTEFMLSKNIEPTPARVPILNLQTNKLTEVVFFDESEVKH
ncbi:MAG: DNA-directed DNA polymerase II small subunit [Asgard group archaeon]|nr:DNA-directed DNA polymerase II small subunit [Asgard group archaeon]